MLPRSKSGAKCQMLPSHFFLLEDSEKNNEKRLCHKKKTKFNKKCLHFPVPPFQQPSFCYVSTKISLVQNGYSGYSSFGNLWFSLSGPEYPPYKG